MATAKKLPSGNWRCRACVTDLSGNKIRRSFTAATKRQAEALAATWAADQNTALSQTGSLLLRDAYSRYIESKANVLSPSTIRNYIKMSETNLQDIMRFHVDQLTQEQIQRSINLLSASRSPKTVKNNYGLLTAVLGMFRPGFRPNITLPERKKVEMFIPSDQTVSALIRNLQGSSLLVPVLLGACCGMREGEISAITSDDLRGQKLHVCKSMVQGPDKKWTIKQPKSYAGDRYIDVPPAVLSVLEGIDGRLCKMTPHSLSSDFRRYLKQNGYPLFRFHDLRHYYVSTLFDAGVPEKYIIAQVGHSSASITRAVYDHKKAIKASEMASLSARSFDHILFDVKESGHENGHENSETA